MLLPQELGSKLAAEGFDRLLAAWLRGLPAEANPAATNALLKALRRGSCDQATVAHVTRLATEAPWQDVRHEAVALKVRHAKNLGVWACKLRPQCRRFSIESWTVKLSTAVMTVSNILERISSRVVILYIYSFRARNGEGLDESQLEAERPVCAADPLAARRQGFKAHQQE